MEGHSFDAVTRKAAAGISRRRSLATLSAAGLAATLAAPFAVEAKKGGKKKKKKKQSPASPPPVAPPPAPAPDLCAAQVEECRALLTNICNGNPDCQDSIDCCSFFATCEAGAFVTCFAVSL